MITIERLGWIIAAAVLGVIVASGFQGSLDKVATVDLATMGETSELGKANSAAIEAMDRVREDLLNFVSDNRVMTMDQAKNLRTLWLKDSPTTADKAALESLKAEIVAASKKNIELSGKPNLTPEERTLLQEYANRSAAIEEVANQWFQDFKAEIQQSIQARRIDTLAKAKAAAQSVARSGGYTLVFDSSVGIYAANDLTAEALKAMNAKK